MELVKVYKEMEVTYGEFEKALCQLGYKKNSAAQPVYGSMAFTFTNEAFDSVIFTPASLSSDTKMLKANFAAESLIMEQKGVLQHRDDLAKMIEQDRLELKKRRSSPVS